MNNKLWLMGIIFLIFTITNVYCQVEPSNYPTFFRINASYSTSLTFIWTDATGATLPTAYLVKGSSVGFGSITNPLDGTPVADGGLNKNVAFGVQSVQFTGLTNGTTYYFKLYPYTGTGANINYKNDAFGPYYVPIVSYRAGLPSPAINPSPGNVINVAQDVTLSWSPGLGVTPVGYRLYWGLTTSYEMMNGVDMGTLTSYHIPTLIDRGTIVYWEVKPYNALGAASFVDFSAWDFRINILPWAFFNPWPVDNQGGITPGTTISFAFGWNGQEFPAGGEPDGYRLYMGTDNPPTNIINGQLVAEPYSGDHEWNFTHVLDLPNTTYYWKVVPYNNVGICTDPAIAIWRVSTGPASYDAYITSNLTGKAISDGGFPTGQVTPHHFTCTGGSSHVYTVEDVAGYTTPASQTVTTGGTYNFVYTEILTYDAYITSNLPGKLISDNGISTGQYTPHHFTCTAGSTHNYSVQWVAGYMQPNTQQVTTGGTYNFVYTLAPVPNYTAFIYDNLNDNLIYDGGVSTGFLTPHSFSCAGGSTHVFSVAPASGYVTPPAQTITSNGMYFFMYTPAATYDAYITSNIPGVTIYDNGVSTGQVAPHHFTCDTGSTHVYSVMHVITQIDPSSQTVTTDGTYNFVYNNPPITIGGGPHTETTIATVAGTVVLPTTPSLAVTAVVNAPGVIVVTEVTPVAKNGTYEGYPNVAKVYQVWASEASMLNNGTLTFAYDPLLGYNDAVIHWSGSFYPAAAPGSGYAFNGAVSSHLLGQAPFTGSSYANGVLTIAPIPVYNLKGSDYFEVILREANLSLPVELSSFTAAQASAGLLVNILWATESETNNMGFNVIRSNDSFLSNGICLNANLILGTNASTHTAYSYTDNEIETANSYYYWLESMDYNGVTTYNGPIFVTVLNQGDPNTPQINPSFTKLNDAYPNPCNPETNISFDLEASDFVNITIYDVKGQMIRTLTSKEWNMGNHHLIWNGTDDNGKQVGSGVYFFQMKTHQYSKTNKVVLLK